jgi:uncharacterized protein YbcI
MASGFRHPAGGSRSTAIANLVVRITSEYTGRGPTQARAYEAGDVITVILQDTLTKGERRLVAAGRIELVLTTRKAFQSTMRADMTEGIEDITGRRVVAFMSDNHLDPDMAAEIFVLAPKLADPGEAPQAR